MINGLEQKNVSIGVLNLRRDKFLIAHSRIKTSGARGLT
jgi:hypothetical protein